MRADLFFRWSVVVTALVLFSGCATVTRGSMDNLEVVSEPSEATIKVFRTNAGFNAKEIKNNAVEDPDNPGAGPLLGTTPATFRLARLGEYRVLIEKEGYESVEVEVGHKWSGAGGAGMAGNVLAGGIVGMVVDARTGSTQDLTPNPIDVTLKQGDGLRVIKLEIEEDKKSKDVDAEQSTEDTPDAPAPSEATNAVEEVEEAAEELEDAG